jgi:Domain of unknown function (DUF222)/HNH endonuclease
MFETEQPGIPPDATIPVKTLDGTRVPVSAPVPADPPAVPLERLEAEICELAGHLAAATCRFLILLGDFDARRGWADWEMTSCAAWLSWKCQMSSGTAREHIRVARALRDLPVIRAEFGAGRLSYAKVRALTRIATPATEAGLAELAGPMTGNQLERFARAHRQVSSVDDAAARVQRRLAWRFEEDGSLSGTFRLPPLAGAVMLKALRAAAGDLEHPHRSGAGHAAREPDVSAETPAGEPTSGRPQPPTSSSLADALLAIAEAFLAEKAAAADDPEVYQVIVHVGTDVITSGSPAVGPPAEAGDVSAETPSAPEPAAPEPAAPPGRPAHPARCHIEDGPAISVSTAQLIACSAALSWMLHDSAGKLLDLGRRRRRPSAALRRAARERDKCRCRFPGCESRRVDLHHIQYWSNGGRTKLDNLVSLCKYHHLLVHDRGYLIAAARDGTFAFYRPDGTAIPTSPPLPQADGTIEDCHDAEITPETIIPPWYGERLDLDYAIWVCFANAANAASATGAASQASQDDDAPPPVQAACADQDGHHEPPPPRPWAIGPQDWMPSLRREYTTA